MKAWGGERGRGEDLTDWTRGGNLEWQEISGKKGKMQSDAKDERGRRRARGQRGTRSPRVGGAGGWGAPGSGSRTTEARRGDIVETLDIGSGEEARDRSGKGEGETVATEDSRRSRELRGHPRLGSASLRGGREAAAEGAGRRARGQWKGEPELNGAGPPVWSQWEGESAWRRGAGAA